MENAILLLRCVELLAAVRPEDQKGTFRHFLLRWVAEVVIDQAGDRGPYARGALCRKPR